MEKGKTRIYKLLKWGAILVVLFILVCNNYIQVHNFLARLFQACCNNILGVITITLVSLLLVRFVIFPAIDYVKNRTENFICFLGYVLVLGIMIIAKNQWCYLAAIIIIAFNMNLVNEQLQDLISRWLNKNKVKDSTKERSKEQDNNISNIEDINSSDNNDNTENCETEQKNHPNDDNIPSNITYTEFQKYISGSALPNLPREKLAILYLQEKTNIPFEIDKKITARGGKEIRPDAIKSYPNIDCIVEVERYSDIIYDQMFRFVRTCIDFYQENYPKQNIYFYLAIITRNNSITSDKIIEIQTEMDNQLAKLNYHSNVLYSFKTYVIKPEDLIKERRKLC